MRSREQLDAPANESERHSRGIALCVVSLLYLCIPAAGVIWLLFDPLAVDVFRIVSDSNMLKQPVGSARLMIDRVGIVRATLACVGAMTLLSLVARDSTRVVSRSRTPLTIVHLLFLTTVIACCFGISVGSEQIAWLGKRVRLSSRIDGLEQLADRLVQEWPTEDGEIPGLGPYTSYPFGRPTVLLLLTPFPLDGTDTVISAIGRSGDTLRFQLGGIDGGDWIERHPQNKVPSSFTGGLADQHQLRKSVSLRSQWFLVRYQGSERSAETP
ncbi:MAG: hypothetical protein AAGD07_05815 [Planctomycetota bacterium]